MCSNSDCLVELMHLFDGENRFNIIHQNIRSLRENFNAFLIVLNGVNKLPDIIVLSEIWINDCESDAFSINGYCHYFACNNEYRAGGVVVYVSQRYSSRLVVPSVEMRTADVVKVIVEIQPTVSLTVLALYRLHSHSKQLFTDEFETILSCIYDRNFLVIGDINLCLFDQSTVSDNYKTLMASFGLDQLINVATRSVGNTKSLIDHIYLRSNGDILCNSGVFPLGITDHDCVSCSLIFENNINNKYQEKKILKLKELIMLN